MKRVPRSAWLLILLLPLAACGKDEPTAPGTTAEQDVQAGHVALASGDYAAANQHYKEALLKNPSHPEANLGAAVTEVYLVQNDPDVAALIDLVSPSPLREEPLPRTRNARVSARLGLGPHPLGHPLAGGGALSKLLGRALEDPPAISEIQAVIRTVVMPRLQYAENRLQVLESDPNFAVKLPPAITEEPDTIEVDRGDILILDAVVNGVQGWLGLLVAYNFDVPSYERVNAESLLAPGTAWATLHTGGALELASARLNLLLVKARLDQAVAAIHAETDDQSDDIILVQDVESLDFVAFLEEVNRLATTLNGAVPVEVTDYQGQPFTLDIHLGAFFTSTIADLKTKFPAHAFDDAGEPYATDPLTFPDPTIGGVFPDMTNARWQQLVGPLPPAARWAVR